MIAIRHLADLSGAPEHIVRDAIAAGIVRPIWHNRTLFADEVSGCQWAKGWRSSAQSPAPKPPPALPAAEPAVKRDRDGPRIKPDVPGAPAKPAKPRPAKPDKELRIVAAQAGETTWSVTQAAKDIGAARSAISSMIRNGDLGVVKHIDARTEAHAIPDSEVQRLRAEIVVRRERYRQNAIARERKTS